MINPTKITKFDRTYEELIEFFTFCACVAGKNSDIVARKVNALTKEGTFWACMYSYPLDENGVWELRMLDLLIKHKIGQYKRIMHILREVVMLDLSECSVERLASIKGIGPKTACFFLLHSRPNQELVVIDTHLLKFYNREMGTSHKKPPTKWLDYTDLGRVIASIIKNKFPKMTLAEADLKIWMAYSGRA